MPNPIYHLKNAIDQLKAGLENTIRAAAKEITLLQTPKNRQYADAVMDQNGFGGDTCEIYFHVYAPRGSIGPSLKPKAYKKFEQAMNDPAKKLAYDKANFEGWKKEIYAIQGVASVFGGQVEVDYLPLDAYLRQLRETNVTPDHRVHVKLVIPGQDELRLARELTECLRKYEVAKMNR